MSTVPRAVNVTTKHPSGLMRGLPDLPTGVLRIASEVGLLAVEGRRPNEVLWWHWCRAEGGWRACGLGAHILTGALEAGTLTIRASLLCPDGCGKHGFVTDNVWSEA